MTGLKVIIFLMKKQLPSLFYGDFKQRSCVYQYGYTMGMTAALRGEECVSLGRDITVIKGITGQGCRLVPTVSEICRMKKWWSSAGVLDSDPPVKHNCH